MAVIHHTTLSPSKLELLEGWLPSQPWYVTTGRPPELAKAGGFRLDDPAGVVGIEFMIVTDQSGEEPVSYLVPLTYRGAPLGGAEQALIGRAEHGVLGTRWVYDGARDPVLLAQLVAFLQGAVVAQAQSVSDSPDPSVIGAWNGAAEPRAEDIRVVRRLQPGEHDPATGPVASRGYVEGGWQLPDGTAVRGLLVVVPTEAATDAD